jgi:ribosomal protein L40E
MAKKTLGYAELQWTCPNCNGINPGTQQDCSSCGAPQPDDVKFEQVKGAEASQDEELKKRAETGADIHCPYCGTRNPGDAEICVACGGDISAGQRRKSGEILGAYETGPVEMIPCPSCGTENPETAHVCAQCGSSMRPPRDEKQTEVEAGITQPGAPEGKKRSPIPLIAIFVVLCCIGAAIIYFVFLRTSDLTGTVSSVGWERSINIEGLIPVEYQDWRDQIPSDGEILNCRDEVRSVESEFQPNSEEVCGTPYSVDTGSGVAEIVQDCEYHVYDDFCTFSVIEWAVVDSVTLSGSDFFPQWPDPALETEQRLGAGTENYVVYFDTSEGDKTYTTTDFDAFQQFDIGSKWTLQVNSLGGVQSVSP